MSFSGHKEGAYWGRTAAWAAVLNLYVVNVITALKGLRKSKRKRKAMCLSVRGGGCALNHHSKCYMWTVVCVPVAVLCGLHKAF